MQSKLSCYQPYVIYIRCLYKPHHGHKAKTNSRYIKDTKKKIKAFHCELIIGKPPIHKGRQKER